jgi:hypothetical protein
MLYNGYGEHNIQGIGDKHIPLIHNVSNTDDAVAITDRATDTLFLLFNTPEGKAVLKRRGVKPELIEGLKDLGLSSICNVLAAIQTARHHQFGSDDVLIMVATDGGEMYGSEIDRITRRDHPAGFGAAQAEAAFDQYLAAGATGDFLELGEVGRRRIFNLGYYTWVEQQGVPFADFESRRDQSFWQSLRPHLDIWDSMIVEFNERTHAGT